MKGSRNDICRIESRITKKCCKHYKCCQRRNMACFFFTNACAEPCESHGITRIVLKDSLSAILWRNKLWCRVAKWSLFPRKCLTRSQGAVRVRGTRSPIYKITLSDWADNTLHATMAENKGRSSLKIINSDHFFVPIFSNNDFMAEVRCWRFSWNVKWKLSVSYWLNKKDHMQII